MSQQNTVSVTSAEIITNKLIYDRVSDNLFEASMAVNKLFNFNLTVMSWNRI